MDYKKNLEALIETVISRDASDLHLSQGRHPSIRVTGDLQPLAPNPVLTKEDTEGYLVAMIGPERVAEFRKETQFDFAYSYRDKFRFRGNAFIQQGHVSIVMRLIPRTIRTIAELNVPQILETFARKQQGFFLVVGPVGQGKTTTLAAMIDLINKERADHIVTIEDPIEYVYDQQKAIIDQREVRIDVPSFSEALTAAFRQDVDVILVGEMRDADTIAAAVTAAETGHLVLSTLHTNNAAQTVDRIIDSFPAAQQDQIRLQLASSLIGIFSQRLVPRISGGLIPAYELLLNNAAVSNLIREKRTHEIDTVIETGSEQGMIDMNRCLAELVQRGEITIETAYQYTLRPQVLERLL
jgi:twitching motility protein PilT